MDLTSVNVKKGFESVITQAANGHKVKFNVGNMKSLLQGESLPLPTFDMYSLYGDSWDRGSIDTSNFTCGNGLEIKEILMVWWTVTCSTWIMEVRWGEGCCSNIYCGCYDVGPVDGTLGKAQESEPLSDESSVMAACACSFSSLFLSDHSLSLSLSSTNLGSCPSPPPSSQNFSMVCLGYWQFVHLVDEHFPFVFFCFAARSFSPSLIESGVGPCVPQTPDVMLSHQGLTSWKRKSYSQP